MTAYYAGDTDVQFRNGNAFVKIFRLAKTRGRSAVPPHAAAVRGDAKRV